MKIQEDYQKAVSALRADDLDREIQKSFKGSALDVPLAKMDATMTLLRENFDKGTITVARFREEVMKISAAKEVLTSFNSLLESAYGAFSNLIVDTLMSVS